MEGGKSRPAYDNRSSWLEYIQAVKVLFIYISVVFFIMQTFLLLQNLLAKLWHRPHLRELKLTIKVFMLKDDLD